MSIMKMQEFIIRFLAEIKKMQGWELKLLANKVHIQGMEVLLADKVHEKEPQRVAICFTHATIPT